MIYKGKYLAISYEMEKHLFVQYWTASPKSINDFKKEMLMFIILYEKFRPLNALWLHENFSLHLDTETQIWIEENVNKPCFKLGSDKCAFVVSKDVLAHINVIDSFDKIKSCVTPKHFLTEIEAREWLNNTNHTHPQEHNRKITYAGIDENGNAVLKIPTQNIKHTFKSISKLVEQEHFIYENQQKLNSLTKREKEIIHAIAQGKKHQEIADILFISLHTVRTHWKNIKAKLDFNSENEVLALLETLKL